MGVEQELGLRDLGGDGLQLGLHGVPDEGQHETAQLIAMMAKHGRYGSPRYASPTVRGKPGGRSWQRQLAMVEAIPWIGPKYAERLLRRLGSVRAVFNASQSQLTQAGIPPATASKIQKLLNTPYVKTGTGRQAEMEQVMENLEGELFNEPEVEASEVEKVDDLVGETFQLEGAEIEELIDEALEETRLESSELRPETGSEVEDEAEEAEVYKVRKITVRLSDDLAERLEAISERYELKDLEEALRFSAHFTIKILDRIRMEKSVAR